MILLFVGQTSHCREIPLLPTLLRLRNQLSQKYQYLHIGWCNGASVYVHVGLVDCSRKGHDDRYYTPDLSTEDESLLGLTGKSISGAQPWTRRPQLSLVVESQPLVALQSID